VRVGTPEQTDVSREQRRLLHADALPLAGDRVSHLGPDLAAMIERMTGRQVIDVYVHRVQKQAGRRDFWILYRVTPTSVVFVALTGVPPPL
jgi:hypothetical protein